MARYRLEVSWTMTATVAVEAESEDAAEKLALEAAELPTPAEYLENSFEVLEVKKVG